MAYDKKELRSLFHRIGGTMLLFLALFTMLHSISGVVGGMLTLWLPSHVAYIFSELLNTLAYALSFLLPAVFFHMISYGRAKRSMGLSIRFSRKKPTLTTLALVFWGIALCFVCSYINSLLVPVSTEVYDSLNSASIDYGYQMLLMFLASAIIPAFVEELLFRGVILSYIRPYNQACAVVISALLFGLMHQTPYQFFYTTALGVVFGVIYIQTRTIWLGVLLHFLNNFFSLWQTFLVIKFGPSIGAVISNVFICAVVAVGLVLGAVVFSMDRKGKENGQAEEIGIYKTPLAERAAHIDVPTAEVFRASCSPFLITYAILCVIVMLLLGVAT